MSNDNAAGLAGSSVLPDNISIIYVSFFIVI